MAAVAALLIAAPPAFAGSAGASFFYNTGSRQLSIDVKNNGTSGEIVKVDFTLPTGTSLKDQPPTGGGDCVVVDAQRGSCEFPGGIGPGKRAFILASTNGSVPSSVEVTATFADGSTVTVTAGTCGTVTVGPPAIPDGTQGAPFSHTFTAAGGTAPYTFDYQGALAAGLNLAQSGVLSGTPTQGGNYGFQIIAMDANGCLSFPPPSFTHRINDAPPPPPPPCPPVLEVTGYPSPQAGFLFTAGHAIDVTPTVTNGTPPFTFQIGPNFSSERTQLPEGLSLDVNTGRIHGSTLVVGRRVVIVTVRDARGCWRDVPTEIGVGVIPVKTSTFGVNRKGVGGMVAECGYSNACVFFLAVEYPAAGPRSAAAAAPRTIGRIRGTVRPRSRGRLSVRLNRAGRRLLARRRSLRVRLTGTIRVGRASIPIESVTTIRRRR